MSPPLSLYQANPVVTDDNAHCARDIRLEQEPLSAEPYSPALRIVLWSLLFPISSYASRLLFDCSYPHLKLFYSLLNVAFHLPMSRK